MKFTTEKILFGIIFFVILLGLIRLFIVHSQENVKSVEPQTLANPASVHCDEMGGSLSMQTRGDGGQYGVCIFPDNQQCEEWALYRGECPMGGVNIAGYDTPAQVYCAITGGQTLATPDASCTLPHGTVCSDEAYYNGTCD